MNDGQARRRRIVGLVGSLFGAEAAGAVERVLPADPEGLTGEPGPIDPSAREEIGEGQVWSWRSVGGGRVLIERDKGTGRLVLSITNREGGEPERYEEGPDELPLATPGARPSLSVAVYDADGCLVRRSGPTARCGYDLGPKERPS